MYLYHIIIYKQSVSTLYNKLYTMKISTFTVYVNMIIQYHPQQGTLHSHNFDTVAEHQFHYTELLRNAHLNTINVTKTLHQNGLQPCHKVKPKSGSDPGNPYHLTCYGRGLNLPNLRSSVSVAFQSGECDYLVIVLN